MPRNAGQLQTWVGPGDRGGIGVTDSSMLLPESEPDPLQAQRLAVPLLEARPVRRLPLLCMWLSFVGRGPAQQSQWPTLRWQLLSVFSLSPPQGFRGDWPSREPVRVLPLCRGHEDQC